MSNWILAITKPPVWPNDVSIIWQETAIFELQNSRWIINFKVCLNPLTAKSINNFSFLKESIWKVFLVDSEDLNIKTEIFVVNSLNLITL